MAIDWGDTGAMVSGFGSFASAASVLIAAFVARNTFEAWKKRRATEREELHAQACLVATFKVTEALQSIRSPLMHGVELGKARKKLEQNAGWEQVAEGQRDRHVTGQVYIDRMIHFEDDFDELAECIPLAKALFDDEVSDALGELHRQRWIIRTYVDAFVEDVGGDRDWSVEIRANLNDHKAERDGVVSVAIRDSLAKIEKVLLPVLRS